MPQHRTVRLEVRDAVATITIDRPGALNSLDTATKVALRDAVLAVAADADVRALVLTGTGRAFCTGQDLREHARLLEAGDGAVWSTVAEHFNPLVSALLTMPKPVVAAVNGVAAGAGAGLAFACDLRVVADSAAFVLAFAGVGLSADSGVSWTLPRLVGHAKALELLLLGAALPAAEADGLGLVTRLVPAGQVLGVAQELAGRLAQGPTVAYGCLKRAVAHGAAHDLAASLALEEELQRVAGATADHRAATAAFLAKTAPRFTGR